MTKNPRAASKAPAAEKKATGKKAALKKVATKKTAATRKPAPRTAAASQLPEKAAPARAAKLAQTAAPAPRATADKPRKAKLVRDSFTMPDNEYALIAQVKKACIGAGFEIKKSELLRIGVAILAKMEPKMLQAAQQALAPLKAGRPKKK